MSALQTAAVVSLTGTAVEIRRRKVLHMHVCTFRVSCTCTVTVSTYDLANVFVSIFPVFENFSPSLLAIDRVCLLSFVDQSSQIDNITQLLATSRRSVT